MLTRSLAQAGGTGELVIFDIHPGLEALVIFFNDPAGFIPAHDLIGVFESLHCVIGNQNPFQTFLTGGWIDFPDTHDPDVH